MVDVQALHERFMVAEATAVLRHDLRNKLAAVRNAAFYVQRRVEKEAPDLLARDARMPQFLAMVRSEVDAADAIITEQAPRVADPTIAAFAVDEAIGWALGRIAGVRHEPSGVMARADAAEVAVALRCLANNALESGARTVAIAASRQGDRAVVEVSDDGPGLADENVARPGHLGLGLRIARRIAARAGGELVLESGAGGVRATLTLPGADA